MTWDDCQKRLEDLRHERHRRAPQWDLAPLPDADEVRDGLLVAQAGIARYAGTGRTVSMLGDLKLWDLEQVGTRPVEPYVMQGGFQVSDASVWKSVLTPDGEELLAELATENAPG